MKMVLDMSAVRSCEVRACMYNRDRMCHAKAITIGGGSDHQCDTMFYSNFHTHREQCAGVGACRVTNCVNNDDCECTADSIKVCFAGDKADCSAFSRS